MADTCSALCPFHIHLVPCVLQIPQLSSCPPSSRGVPADHILKLLPQSLKGLFGQQQLSTWNSTWMSPVQSWNIAQDYQPRCLLWQTLFSFILASHFEFVLCSSFISARSTNFFSSFSRKLSVCAHLSAPTLTVLYPFIISPELLFIHWVIHLQILLVNTLERYIRLLKSRHFIHIDNQGIFESH